MMELITRSLSGLTLALFLATSAVAGSLTPSAHAPGGEASSGSELPLADRILVRKAERRLYVLKGAEIIRSYRIALGLNPKGPKEREGDFRTPEGSYHLARRNPRSDYFLSMEVSYPNDLDRERARRNRWQPGGLIMIHGLPNTLKWPPDYYAKRDWTNGCIALSNSDMLELWLITPDNVPIEIRP